MLRIGSIHQIKAVVGADRPMNVQSKHIQLYWKNCQSSHRCDFVKKKISNKLLHVYVQYVYIV